jgi:hypothetical protein
MLSLAFHYGLPLILFEECHEASETRTEWAGWRNTLDGALGPLLYIYHMDIYTLTWVRVSPHSHVTHTHTHTHTHTTTHKDTQLYLIIPSARTHARAHTHTHTHTHSHTHTRARTHRTQNTFILRTNICVHVYTRIMESRERLLTFGQSRGVHIRGPGR